MKKITKEMVYRRRGGKRVSNIGFALMIGLPAIWLLIATKFNLRGYFLQIFVPAIGVPIFMLVGLMSMFLISYLNDKRPVGVPEDVCIRIRVEPIVNKREVYSYHKGHKSVSHCVFEFQTGAAKIAHAMEYDEVNIGDRYFIVYVDREEPQFYDCKNWCLDEDLKKYLS
jgi:hypothetical protein